MNTPEKNIRNYLKEFTAEDIANSVYLFGINLDDAPIDSIMQSLSSLYEEVGTLDEIVNENFEPKDGEPVLLPKGHAIQKTIIRDYYRKKSALLKALENKDVYNAFVNYEMAKITTNIIK